jgi:ribosome maturation factor RimP
MDVNITKIEAMVQALLDGTSFFLINIKIKPTNNIKVYLDGDQGITINDISKLNRTLYNQIEEAAWYPDGDFSLEVSSPGIDEPLKFIRQYIKNIGRHIEITPLEESEAVTEGKLLAVDATNEIISIEITTGKKKEISEVTIPIKAIKTAIVQIKF